MTLKSIPTIAALLIMASILWSQEEPKRLAVFGIDLSEYREKIGFQTLFLGGLLEGPNALNSIPEYLIKALSGNNNLIIIDRLNYNLILEERERQKSEDFIDGYTVQQGKSEGVDFLMKPRYNDIDRTVSVRVIDVATEEVYCEVQTKLIRKKVSKKYTGYYIDRLLDGLNENCFNIDYQVIKITESKKEKAKEILVAAGSSRLIEEGKVLELFEREKIEVNGNELFRPTVIGACEVIRVEGADFSIAQITDGHAEIFKRLNEGAQLYCRIKSIDQ